MEEPGKKEPSVSNTYELRDPVEARKFILQGLWWQRALPPRPATVRQALEWALEVASQGQPLPPLGFLADLGHIALGLDAEDAGPRDLLAMVPLNVNLLRTYEDHVLGKLYADWTFGKASDALRRYKPGRDQARGLAFLLDRFHERAHYPGIELSPGVISAALASPPEEVHNEGWEMLRQEGGLPLLETLYDGLVTAARRTAEVLAPEDVFQLENETALAPDGERLAQRQVLRAANLLEGMLPRHGLRPPLRTREVPTRILDEDTYPVGGFTSLSNRGSVESLLHSQLAYMEDNERPDLFDIKFLRDELLYYARDENQFLRRRRTFVFVLSADLTQTRFKDAALPFQRGVLLVATIVVLIRKLSEWLNTDALSFHLVFVRGGKNAEPLAEERKLLERIFREMIPLGTLAIDHVATMGDAADLCGNWSRRSLCHCLRASITGEGLDPEDTFVTRLRVDGPRPSLAHENDDLVPLDSEDAIDSWGQALQEILESWV
jgi:hypothetical protein